jgi:hypothetical protein
MYARKAPVEIPTPFLCAPRALNGGHFVRSNARI